MRSKATNEITVLKMSYRYYKSYQGDGQKSGAYIFRPATPDEKSIKYSKFTSGKEFKGNHMSSMTITDSNFEITLKTHKDSSFIEVETNHLGIQNDWLTSHGKELIIHFETVGLQNDETFWTDSMGLQMQKRIFDYRETWEMVKTEIVSENYYPVIHGVFIEDKESSQKL